MHFAESQCKIADFCCHSDNLSAKKNAGAKCGHSPQILLGYFLESKTGFKDADFWQFEHVCIDDTYRVSIRRIDDTYRID